MNNNRAALTQSNAVKTYSEGKTRAPSADVSSNTRLQEWRARKARYEAAENSSPFTLVWKMQSEKSLGRLRINSLLLRDPTRSLETKRRDQITRWKYSAYLNERQHLAYSLCSCLRLSTALGCKTLHREQSVLIQTWVIDPSQTSHFGQVNQYCKRIVSTPAVSGNSPFKISDVGDPAAFGLILRKFSA